MTDALLAVTSISRIIRVMRIGCAAVGCFGCFSAAAGIWSLATGYAGEPDGPTKGNSALLVTLGGILAAGMWWILSTGMWGIWATLA